MKQLITPSLKDFEKLRDKIYPSLVAACIHSSGRFEAQDIINQIKSYDVQIWLAFEDDQLEGFLLSHVVIYPRAKTLKIFCCVGVGIDGPGKFISKIGEWIPSIAKIEEWAKSIGCNRSQIECPASWAIVLRDTAYKTTHIILDKDIT